MTRVLALAACALSALAILGASAAAAEPGTEEQPASAPSSDVPAPADGEFTQSHMHGVLSARVSTFEGQVFSVFDSAGGYYGSSDIAHDPRPSGR